MKGKKFNRRRNKRGVLLWVVVAACLIFTGCASFGSYSLNQSVNKYDESVLQSEQQILLRNIIRMHDDQPLHLTEASGISATFTLSGTGGLTPSITSNTPASQYYATTTAAAGLSLGSTISESPLITITPMKGKDYAERLLKPVDDKFINMLLLQRSEPKLDKMLRLIGKNFYLMGPESTKEVFDKLEDLSPTDFEGLPLKNSQGNIVLYYDYPFLNTDDLKDKKKKLEDLKDKEEEKLKALKKEKEELKAKKDEEKEKKNEFHNLIVKAKKEELVNKRGFTPEEANCILDTSDGCYMENKPQIIREGETIRRDITRYELFRKLVLHIQALALTGRLQYSSLYFSVPVEGTLRKAKDLSTKDFKDIIDAFEKQYLLEKTGKEQLKDGFMLTDRSNPPIEDTFMAADDLKGKDMKNIFATLKEQYSWQKVSKFPTKENIYTLTKRYPIIAITDFDIDSMKIENRKGLLKKIQEDLELNVEIKLGEGMIIVLLRGDPVIHNATIDYSSSWPIYGYFTLRNFNQMLQFVAESLSKDKHGYATEYDVLPGEFTKNLLDRFKEFYEELYKKKMPRLRLDNPELTLTINSDSETTRPKYRLVDVEYNGNLFWISPQTQTGAPSTGNVSLYVNPYSPRWDAQVFNMIYEIFQFNRIDAVPTPSISIPNK